MAFARFVRYGLAKRGGLAAGVPSGLLPDQPARSASATKPF